MTRCQSEAKIYLVFHRPGRGAIFILKPTSEGSKPDFKAVYSQIDSSSSAGIGQYDLRSSADRIFPFDYRSNGIADHLVLDRPGSGVLHIVRNTAGTFSRIYVTLHEIGSPPKFRGRREPLQKKSPCEYRVRAG